jgi:hypothetical protein
MVIHVVKYRRNQIHTITTKFNLVNHLLMQSIGNNIVDVALE